MPTSWLVGVAAIVVIICGLVWLILQLTGA